MTHEADDPLDRLGRTPGDDARFLETLPVRVGAALGQDDAVGVELDEDGAAWLLRAGERITTFDPGALAALSPADADRAVAAFAELVRRYDRERGFRDDLVIGARVRVDYRHMGLRRTFRMTGIVRSVSGFRPGSGVRAGGWTVEIEVRPRFGKPAVQPIEGGAIVEIARL
jgi:hypothetical protein